MIETLIMTFLIILLITIIILQKRSNKSNYPPGPFSWPFFGNTYYLKKLSKKYGGQHLAFLELNKRYNSSVISLGLGVNDTIVISDHKLINEILNKREYDARPWNEFTKLRNMGMKRGITMNDGPEQKILKTWTMRTLKNVGFAKQEMVELLSNELALILEKFKDGGVECIQTVIAPTVINVLWTLISGKRLSEDQSRLKKFLDLMNQRSKIFDLTGGILSSFPWLRYLIPEISGYKILVTLNNELKNLLMEAINDHKQRYVEGKEEDFIDAFLHEMFKQQNNSVFSDENLIVTLLDLFIAGTKTTTATLDFLFLEIVNNQDAQRKLHEEIDVVIGPDRFPTLEDRVKMPFTEAILTETQRMRMIIPLIGPRRVLDNTTLGGYTIPKNSTILMNVIPNINMNADLYPDPTLFKPERHLNENGAFKMDENVITFGKGKRRCPGEALARGAMFLLFVGIMQKYCLLPTPGEKSIKVDIISGLILMPKPYKVLIVPR